MEVDGRGDARLVHRGIGERDVEIVDVLPELPLETAAFALAEQVGLIKAEEPADPRALPHRRAEVDVPGPLLGHAEDDVDIALVVGRLGIGEWHRLIEEAEVRHALVGRDQRILAEHVPRHHHDRFADHAVVRDVVAADLDVIDDRRLPFGDHPAQVDHRVAVGRRAPNLVVPHVHVDVAVVVIERLQLARRVLPHLIVEIVEVVPAAEAQQAGALLARERIEGLQLLGRKAPVADDLERSDAVRLALADPDDERGLPRLLADDERVVEHLKVDVALFAVKRRQRLPQVLGDLVVVVFAGAEPPESLRPRLHLRGDFLIGEMRVALHIHLCDRDAAAFVDVEDDAHGGGIPLVDEQRLRVLEVVAPGVVQRVDPRPGALDARQVQRPSFGQRHLVAHAVLRQSLYAAHRPLHELRPLVHADHEHVLAALGS